MSLDPKKYRSHNIHGTKNMAQHKRYFLDLYAKKKWKEAYHS